MPRESTRRRPHHRRPRGAALLVCLFVILVVSSLVLNMLDTETLQLASARNIEDHERALYLANAAVHHACALLEADNTWRGTVTDGSYPADDTYTVTATDGSVSGTVLLQATGASGNVTRSLDATIDL
ncbi:MAG: hypothetical protein AAF596_00765 [Planctomycetota bacterium]